MTDKPITYTTLTHWLIGILGSALVLGVSIGNAYHRIEVLEHQAQVAEDMLERLRTDNQRVEIELTKIRADLQSQHLLLLGISDKLQVGR